MPLCLMGHNHEDNGGSRVNVLTCECIEPRSKYRHLLHKNSTDGSIYRLIDRLINLSIDWLIDRLIG